MRWFTIKFLIFLYKIIQDNLAESATMCGGGTLELELEGLGNGPLFIIFLVSGLFSKQT